MVKDMCDSAEGQRDTRGSRRGKGMVTKVRRYIDAHVHITQATALGTKNERFGTEVMPYGYLKMGNEGFYTMPPYVHDSQFTEDTLVKLLDVYGVEKAVILQSLMSPQNEAVARAVEKYPERLAGAMIVEPVDDWEEQMQYWRDRGLRAIKFEMRAYTNPAAYPDISYMDPRMLKFFENAQRLGLTVTIDPAPVDFPVYDPEKLCEAVRRFPDLHFVLCHMGYPRPVDTPELERKWEQMLSVAALPNCFLDVSAMPDFFDKEGWPYPTALRLLRKAKEVAGAEKLIWGTDISGTLNRATYSQMIEMFYRADCLNEEELDGLFYRNAVRAYRL